MIWNDLQLLGVDQETVLSAEYFVSIKRKCQIKRKKWNKLKMRSPWFFQCFGSLLWSV